MYCDRLVEIAIECKKSHDLTHLCEVCIGEPAKELQEIRDESKRKKVKALLDMAQFYIDTNVGGGKNFPVTSEAIKVLNREKDPEIKEKAISHIENILNRETPNGGKYTDKLTSKDVGQLIEKERSLIPYVSIEELPKPKKIEEWRRPFQRPRIIYEDGEQVQISMQLSEAEFDFVKKISDGVGMLDLSRAYDCDVATIHREIRVVAQKITAGRIQ